MRESLPDEYTLMDVAYIYTWKRNGPMKFFYRICQSQKDPTLAPGEKRLRALAASASAEQPSPTSSTLQSSSTVCRLTEPFSSNAKDVSEAIPQATAVVPPETLKQTVVTTVAASSSSDKPTFVSVQSHVVSVTTSVTQSSPTTAVNTQAAVQMSVVASTKAPIKSNSSQLLHNSSTGIHIHSRTRLINKGTNQSSVTITRTPSALKPINSLTSAVTKTPIRPLAIPSSKASLPSLATASKTMQKQTPSITVSKIRQQPLPTGAAKQTHLEAGTGISAQQPNSETFTKEVSQIATVKTSAHSSSTDSTQPQNQPSSVADNSLPKSGRVTIGEHLDDNIKTPPSSSIGLGDTGSKPLPKQVQPSESGTANCKETSAVNCMDRLPTEVNRKPVSVSGVTTTVPPDAASKTKPTLTNSVQQRAQMLARNSSVFVKVTPNSANNKEQLSTARHQLQVTKDSARPPRVNQKIVDKHANNLLTSRKDKPDDGDKKDVREESVNAVPDPEKGLDKKTSSTNSTPLASNNNNKISHQSLQIIKNNQQILKKNDEIMRCPNTIKRTAQILQRKPQDTLKTCGQLRANDDKSTSKKRCILATNPVKRHLVNSVDATGQDNLEPASKKWRLGVENNHRTIHVDQKSSEFKVKCTSNPSESETSKNVTGESSQVVPKTTNSSFQSPAHVETTEGQKGHGVQNNGLTDKVESPIPMQRPAHKNLPNILSKQYDGQAPKSDQILGSLSVSRNGQQISSVPVPAAAHCNFVPRLQPPSLKGKQDGDCNDIGALDLSASPRRQQQSNIMSIAQTLARRHQQQCPSPGPPPLSPLSSLSPFPVMSIPVRSPPPQLRIPIPPLHRSGHSQQQRPSSLSSSSPSPPADTLPGCSRSGLQRQQPADIYPSHLLPSSAVMFRQQLEMNRFWNSNKHNTNPSMDWFNDAKSVKSFENFMKTLQQQQGNRNSPYYPYNNTNAAPNSHRK
ncbi:uncharacterized protein LOC110839226 isoform X2 [Zootermopsis nevadensis]|uniref:Polycomb group protein Psc n=2 Tax=Zootermopsis nevadensis TaxID=136037 RepID=A0A067QTG4_ZOONE|nr:uncharacterized protein LOC110839226 isoform X2 [Zootermopsis nevadensis]KDR08848.1 Polycomb group protein Psc [Zootermopsis nevadensis]